VVGARETALRAEAQVFHGHELRGGVDAALEVVLLLQLREFGADETQDDALALGRVAQRLEAAGALGVVLEGIIARE
jgi:hypothetical protein